MFLRTRSALISSNHLLPRLNLGHLALLLVLLLGVAAVAVRRERTIGVAAAPKGPSAGNLQGQPALDYLKEQGLYDRLSASIEKAQYEIDRAPRASQPRTSQQRGQSDDRAQVYTA